MFLFFVSLLCLTFWLFSPYAKAQNGDVFFGPFRVQHQIITWQTYPSGKYNLYYPKEQDSTAALIVKHALPYFQSLEDSLQFTFRQKVNIILYPSTQALEQSNIGQEMEKLNPGGTIQFSGNRLLLAYAGSRSALLYDLKLGLVRVLLEDNFYGSKAQEIMEELAKGDLPAWFWQGAAAYEARDWDAQTDNQLKQVLQTQRYTTFNDVAQEHPALMGRALLYYIDHTYREGSVKRLIFQTRVKKNINTACRLALKEELGLVQQNCLRYWIARFQQDDGMQDSIKMEQKLTAIPLKQKQWTVLPASVAVNSSGTLMAFARYRRDQLQVVLQSTTDPKLHKTVYHTLRDSRNNNIVTSYPLLQFANDQLGIVLPAEGEMKLITVNGFSGDTKTYPLPGELDGVDHFAFNPKGTQVVLSAWNKGQSDLYLYQLNKQKLQQLTDDGYDDLQASFCPDGILFLTNRPTDTLHSNKDEKPTLHYSWMVLPETGYAEARRSRKVSLKRVNAGDSADVQQQASDLFNTSWLNNANGVMNLYESKAGATTPATNLSLNVQAPVSDKSHPEQWLAFTVQGDTLRAIRVSPKGLPALPLTQYKKEVLAAQVRQMALQMAQDSLGIITATEQSATLQLNFFGRPDSTEVQRYRDSLIAETIFRYKKVAPYSLKLTGDYVTAQLDNSLMLNRYQSYAFYQGCYVQPRLGGLIQFSVGDLFEDYKVTTGFRLPAAGGGSDYFLRIDNYKKRLDWNLSYYRKVEKITLDADNGWKTPAGVSYPNYIKMKTHYLEAGALYPFSVRSAVAAHLGVRSDRAVFIATSPYSLRYPDSTMLWGLGRVEWMYDDTEQPMANIRKGFRAMVFAEFQQQIAKANEGFLHVGVDLRYYLPVYKNIVWANKLNAATSSDDGGVMYTLGGVSNWLAPVADSSVKFSQQANYSFTSYTNSLRGYVQNIRYGNTYVLLNSEVRVPILNTFWNTTTKWNVINNLQWVAFTDVGNAWRYLGDKTTKASPWVAGYGTGLRSTLLSYFVRMDVAWASEKQPHAKGTMLYFSLAKDF